jgi:hopanoid-associated phosphorylase
MKTAISVVAVCGLKREAKMLAKMGVATVIGGGITELLHSRLDSITASAGIISVGICAALSPSLKVGDCVVANEIIAGGDRFGVNLAWRDRIATRLPEVAIGSIAGSDTVLIDGESKNALQNATGAIAADMESHVAAAFAAKRGIAFAALRVVSDQANVGLPPVVLKAMKPDGRIAFVATFRSLAASPAQLPAVFRTAWESEIAFRALFRCLSRLGPGLLGPDLC